MKKRRPRHRLEIREPAHVRAVELHREDIGVHPRRIEAPPDDARAVGRKERPAVVARRVGEPALVGAVHVHDVDVAEPRGVFFQARLFLRAQLVIERRAQRAEDDLFPIGRDRALGVVAARVGELRELRAVLVAREDVHRRVVVPRVALCFSRRAEVEFRLLFRRRLGVVVRGREDDARGAGHEKAARRFPRARRDARRFAGEQIEEVDLVKGIRRVALGLENHRVAIRREVSLAAALAVVDKLAGVREEAIRLQGVVGDGHHRQHADQCERAQQGHWRLNVGRWMLDVFHGVSGTNIQHPTPNIQHPIAHGDRAAFPRRVTENGWSRPLACRVRRLAGHTLRTAQPLRVSVKSRHCPATFPLAPRVICAAGRRAAQASGLFHPVHDSRLRRIAREGGDDVGAGG